MDAAGSRTSAGILSSLAVEMCELKDQCARIDSEVQRMHAKLDRVHSEVNAKLQRTAMSIATALKDASFELEARVLEIEDKHKVEQQQVQCKLEEQQRKSVQLLEKLGKAAKLCMTDSPGSGKKRRQQLEENMARDVKARLDSDVEAKLHQACMMAATKLKDVVTKSIAASEKQLQSELEGRRKLEQQQLQSEMAKQQQQHQVQIELLQKKIEEAAASGVRLVEERIEEVVKELKLLVQPIMPQLDSLCARVDMEQAKSLVMFDMIVKNT